MEENKLQKERNLFHVTNTASIKVFPPNLNRPVACGQYFIRVSVCQLVGPIYVL
jgi:hypothetical protein